MKNKTNKSVVTIGDRIRNMSDEELVKYFWDKFDDEKFCTGVCRGAAEGDGFDCNECRLAMLRKPAGELYV